VTDGDSNDSPYDIATKAKNAGVEIFCVGIGKEINEKRELLLDDQY
jgi:hypothetical protein